MDDFERELSSLLNAHSVENESNTADFILARYLRACLDAWNEATAARERWYGAELRPGRCRNCGESGGCSCRPLAVSDRDGDGSARPS